jgi:DNA-3-methyladenine glycosylase II
MKGALTERLGVGITVDGATHRAFPEPARLAAVAPDELAHAIGNGRKAGFLHAAATAFSTVDESFLRTAAYDDVEGWLRRIPGIGAWSAAFVLLRGLGRMERVTVANEAKLLETTSRVYGQGQPHARVEAQAIAERYGPWQGYWAHYLRVAG